ncbi:MAG: ABC transporter permease [Candidatus Tectomicrobia bacterium]|nr:ABC transporter permease [Candidatus Tectomicrobia bacterium]
MGDLVTALSQAISWLFTGHREVYDIIWVSVKVVMIATLLATLLGVPVGVGIASNQFYGKRLVVAIFNTLLSMPTVVVGLTVYAFLSRRGPLGELGLLFTPWAVIIGDVILAFPIVVAFSIAAVQGIDPRIRETALSLGAGSTRVVWTVLGEARLAICAAVVAAFGRIIAEVGAAAMLGGNIRGYTRTITTAMALETSKGEFTLGLALGIVLLIIAFIVNTTLYFLQGKTS